MVLIVDVGYREERANIGLVVLSSFEEEAVIRAETLKMEGIAPYESGSFYKRELPCLESAVVYVPEKLTHIVIDGNVWLDDLGKKGLGSYLYDSLRKKIPVIGVAKNRFKSLNEGCRSILRGESTNPLHITAVGIELAEAADLIRTMQGEFRIPTHLKLADSLSRTWE